MLAILHLFRDSKVDPEISQGSVSKYMSVVKVDGGYWMEGSRAGVVLDHVECSSSKCRFTDTSSTPHFSSAMFKNEKVACSAITLVFRVFLNPVEFKR